MRTAIYVRVSTVTHSQPHTIEEQINRLRARLFAHGEDVADQHIFRDEGRSGATLNRPALDRLRDQVRLGDYDRILVTSPDRLARNYVHQMLLLEELERAGSTVEFLDQPMGDTPHDHLLLQIRGAVAEYERALIGDRMRRGRLARYRAGLLLPWTRPVYGYLLDPERPRDPKGVRLSEAEAAVVRQIFAWYLEDGASLSSIVNRLFAHGVASPSGRARWRHTSVRFLLRNPAYTGVLYAARTRTRRARARRSALEPVGKRDEGGRTLRSREEWVRVGTIPALVTPEQYEFVQQKLARNRQFAARNNTTHDYLLRALVSCGFCGLAATGRTARGRLPLLRVCREEGRRSRGRWPLPVTPDAGREVGRVGLGRLVRVDPAAATDRVGVGAGVGRELVTRRVDGAARESAEGTCGVAAASRAADRSLPRGRARPRGV